MRVSKRRTGTLIILAACALAGLFLGASTPATGPKAAESGQSQTSPVFTPAHRSLLDAIQDFFAWRSAPIQPIAYTHKTHLARGMQCTDCHASVEKGPVASIPSVKLCMTCHQVIATDRPEIRKVAAYLARGEEIPWQRVYGYSPTAHVKFNHAPHIRAKVSCATCHGDMTQQTVAVRAVNLNMGSCVDCHKLKKVSLDCTTCHF